jgi:alkyl sulfatase BDS1-like metallo-beta-lactamase superfamily hydrolase
MHRVLRATLTLAFGIALAVCACGQDEEKPVKISDAIFMVPASGNVYLVKTPAGDVVIDTAIAEIAGEVKKIFDREPHGPIKYIILTHAHADHIGGISLWKQPDTQIVAQRNYVEFVHYVNRLDAFFAPRNAAAFNRAVQSVQPWAGNFGGNIDPTILFDENYKFTLGGVEFDLFSTPGETPDHLTVWIPAYKAAFIGDNYFGIITPEPNSFPNLYAIRGTKPRWALDWIQSLDTVIALKPEILLNGHSEPIVGNAEITRRLTRYRDAIQYVHDETVKGMNAGKDVFTLMQEIKLPPQYDLTEIFGKVSWSVRGIYDGYAGWFDGNPSSMYAFPASSVYPDLVKLAGGPEPVTRLALEKVEAGKPVEALHLTDVVLAYDQKNSAALLARVKAMEYLRQHTQNQIESGWLDYGIRLAKEKLAPAQ